jgi:hypothetical protein
VSKDQTIHIADHGTPLTIQYADARAAHKGDAYWGCALAFRLLQRAEPLLSKEQLWDRSRLTITSGHPGPGVRDVIEAVTGCVSAGRYQLSGGQSDFACVSDMRYEWLIEHGDQKLQLQLREGFVPAAFLALLDAVNQGTASDAMREELEGYKRSMSRQIWEQPLEQSFPCRLMT